MGLENEDRRMRRVQKREDRKDGWTDQKKDRFIETLAATCNIAASLRAVEMSRGGLEKLRARDGSFRARMADARRRAYLDLEFFALEKLMNGTVKTVTKADGKVETVHEYPIGLAMNLLRLHRDVAGSAEAEEAAEPSEEQRLEVVERVMRKLRKLRARIDREDAQRGGGGAAAAPGSDGGSGGGVDGDGGGDAGSDGDGAGGAPGGKAAGRGGDRSEEGGAA